MSQVILKSYEDGHPEVVVGWDRPMESYFWQHFHPSDADAEIIGFGGYGFQSIPTVVDLIAEMPKELRSLMTEQVVNALGEHQSLPYPESNTVIDFSGGAGRSG